MIRRLPDRFDDGRIPAGKFFPARAFNGEAPYPCLDFFSFCLYYLDWALFF
ncbi:hypothetical protein B4135_0801 [Caldibacillus debilis]|uniref:Uncharacterized protein n=1 Tax=Caldibacillus debilis TaxID=301148 RepID=A0A150M6R8_9BACI|nr:hypothetical protein B4135_0801 [Caldibacillus debilis]